MKQFIAGWFYDPLTGNRMSDVIVDLDNFDNYLFEATIGKDKEFKNIMFQIQVAMIRSRIQPTTLGLFKSECDLSREEIHTLIEHLDEHVLKDAAKEFKKWITNKEK